MAKLLKWLLIALCGFLLSLSFHGCAWIKFPSQVKPLAFVAELPSPKLPNWIESISPTKEVNNLGQIRIVFQNPLIPLTSLDNPQQQQILAKFSLQPEIKGRFRFLTPRMVGFTPDEIFPLATRIQVTLLEGLQDLNNNHLEKDLAWTFNTDRISLTGLPGINAGELETSPREEEYSEPVNLRPQLQFLSNVELDLDSLRQSTKLFAAGKSDVVGVEAKLVKNEEDRENFSYSLTPVKELSKGTRYNLEFAPGLKPLQGNLPSEAKITSYVNTYAPLTWEKIEYYGKPDVSGAYGRFVNGGVQLKFNNGLVAASALENIKIKPKPKNNNWLRVYEGENLVTINPWALTPQTNYQVTIFSNLKDKFGQILGKDVSISFNPGDIAGDIWAPSGLNIFPSGQNLQLDISAVNIPDSSYQAAYRKLQPEDLVYYNNYVDVREKEAGLLPPSNSWGRFPLKTVKNTSTAIHIPIKEKLQQDTGMLAYGVKAKTNTFLQEGKTQWREGIYSGLVQLTNLGVFAQWFPQSGLVRVHRLDNGLSVAKAEISIYQSQLEAKVKSKPVACFTGATDKDGNLKISGEAYKNCLKGLSLEYGSGPQLLVIAQVGEDWAFTRTEGYSGAYEYGIDAQWDDGKLLSRGIIFSDRALYRPGEKVYLTGVTYVLSGGKLRRDSNSLYNLTLEDPNGKKRNLGKYQTNQFGSFSLNFTLKDKEELGNYLLRAVSPSGVEITGDIRVAEFKPPNFNVKVDVDKPFINSGEKLPFVASSNYLFGAPLTGAKVKYYVTRRPIDFIPSGWENFTFGPQWFWPEEKPEIDSMVMEGNAFLNEEGKNSAQIQIDKDLPYVMEYRLDAEVTDVSNLAVATSQTFTALPSPKLIGLRSKYIGEASKNFPVEVIVTDSRGKVQAGENVALELQEIKYISATEVIEGSLTEQNRVEYKTVEKVNVKSNDKPVTVSLTPKLSGSYRLVATMGKAVTQAQIWVTGSEGNNWGNRYDNNRLEIHLDKNNYRVGDKARVLIPSPYSDAELYLAVVRDKILYQSITKVKGSAPEIEFTITEDMLPNAAVEVVLVRQGKPLQTVDVNNIDGLMKIGFAPFTTDLQEKYLNIDTTVTEKNLEPGATQKIDLTIKDSRGNPISGQLTVMVVNEAILQLTGYRLPDLVKTVYAEQPIFTRFADNRPQVVLQKLTSPLEKGWGYGGGFSQGDANTRTRINFQPLAYYNGSIITNQEGKATINFSLPDDLTTWRVMVVAMDKDFHFGNSETTFITNKPLVTNPVLPTFVRVGDKFSAGVAVTNSQEKGNLQIQGNLSGAIKFTEKSNLNIPAVGAGLKPAPTQVYRFPMMAIDTGVGTVKFTSQLNNLADAFTVPLTVKATEVEEKVIDAGITNNKVEIPLNITKDVLPNRGGLTISLASNLLPTTLLSAQSVLETNLPFLETLASQLSIAANLKSEVGAISNEFVDDGENTPKINQVYLQEKGKQTLKQLVQLQREDGGFASLPKSEVSDAFLTPYAAISIAQAKDAGWQVSPEIITRLQKYLDKLILNPNKYCATPCSEQIRLQSLIAINALGNPRQDFLLDIYSQRKKLDFVSQLQLTNYLFNFPQWAKEAQTSFQELQSLVYQSGRSSIVNLPKNNQWLNSATTAQAEALQLFIKAASKPENIDKLLQGLLSKRRNGSWGNTYDDAQGIKAMMAYKKIQPPVKNLTANVSLNQQFLGEFRLENNAEINIPMQKLPAGNSKLILQKKGKGNVHYLTNYSYNLAGNTPGRFNGLRITRIIHPVNKKQVLTSFSLEKKQENWQINTGEIFDIELEIISDRPLDNVLITEYLPGALEAVDTTMQTNNKYYQAQADSWEIDYQKILGSSIIAYADKLQPGVYQLHYLARSITPGEFFWPGAEVKLQYEPEVFGRCSSSSLTATGLQ